MIRSVILFVFISIAIANCLPASDTIPSLKLAKLMNLNLINTQSFDRFQNSIKAFNNFQMKEYTFGDPREAELPLSEIQEVNEFSNKKDVEIITGYPTTGLGEYVVTFVQVFVVQESDFGGAEISQGGINQNVFGVRITAEKTSAIAYLVAFYGKLK